MKKLFLGLAIAASSLTFAQTFGVKGGMNVSSLSKDETLSDQKSKIGFNAGAFVNIPITSQFSIQPELLYNGLGEKSVGTYMIGNQTNGVKTNTSYTTSLSYLAVPVMFQYNVIPNLYLEAGPEFGFLLGGKYKGDITTTTYTGGSTSTGTTTKSESIDKGDYKSLNVGVGIGAGYYFTPNIGVTARYVAGVTDIYKNNSGDAVKNNAFQIGVAYKFGKFGK